MSVDNIIHVNGTIPTKAILKWIEYKEDMGVLKSTLGMGFNFDIELTEGEEGIIEGTVRLGPGDGDRGLNNEWADIQNLGGEYQLHIYDDEDEKEEDTTNASENKRIPASTCDRCMRLIGRVSKYVWVGNTTFGVTMELCGPCWVKIGSDPAPDTIETGSKG